MQTYTYIHTYMHIHIHIYMHIHNICFFSLQVVIIVLRWVDDDFDVHEEFVGLYEVPSIEASTLHFVIKYALLRMNLSLARARRQCYDRSSNMCGVRSGVAKRIQDENLEPFSHIAMATL